MSNLITSLSALHWLGLSIILFGVELLAGIGFLLWVGLSALMVSLLVWLVPSLSESTQLLAFCLFTVFSVIGWRLYLQYKPIKTDKPTLNSRAAQYIGQAFVLAEPIINGRGKLIVDDTQWRVQGPNLPAGSTVTVIDIDNVNLVVEDIGHL